MSKHVRLVNFDEIDFKKRNGFTSSNSFLDMKEQMFGSEFELEQYVKLRSIPSESAKIDEYAKRVVDHYAEVYDDKPEKNNKVRNAFILSFVFVVFMYYFIGMLL